MFYVAAGFFSGIISGMGIGGGAILIPALTLLFGMGQLEAQHMNLLFFLPTAAIALVTHKKNGNIEKRGLIRLILFGLLGAAVGAFIAAKTDAGLLRKGFGLFLFAMGVYTFCYKSGESKRKVS